MDDSGYGRRRFLSGVVGGVAAGALVAGWSEGVSAAVPVGATRFVPLPGPIRLADTRDPGRFPFGLLPWGIRVVVAGRAGVSASARAAVLTVTAVNRSGANFVSVFPAGGRRPEVSSVNMARSGEAVANLVIVPIGADGAVDLAPVAPTDLMVDVVGWFEPVSGPVPDGRFVPLAGAERVLDTRSAGVPVAGSSVDVALGAGLVPSDATSVVVNLTTTATTTAGYFTCYPLGVATPPEASNLNVNGSGETRAAAAVVRLASAGGRRGFRVFTSGGGHVIVDVAGYFTGPQSPSSEDGLFVPMDPQRILDTRRVGTTGRLWPRWVTTARVPGSAAVLGQAVAVNLTATDTRDPGYFTVYPAGGSLRSVSNLNATRRDETVPNFAISRISTEGLAVFSQAGGHVLVDIAGWFTGRPEIPRVTYVNPAPPAAVPPWVLEVPRMRHTGQVRAGRSGPTVDAGFVWHWTGTGYLGQSANVGLFAHRTDAGGPFFNLHQLQRGDEVVLRVAGRSQDRRRFRYRVVREEMVANVRVPTPSNVQRILAATRRHPGTTLSLIACSRLDRLPTDLDHRLVVTAELVGWTET